MQHDKLLQFKQVGILNTLSTKGYRGVSYFYQVPIQGAALTTRPGLTLDHADHFWIYSLELIVGCLLLHDSHFECRQGKNYYTWRNKIVKKNDQFLPRIRTDKLVIVTNSIAGILLVPQHYWTPNRDV